MGVRGMDGVRRAMVLASLAWLPVWAGAAPAGEAEAALRAELHEVLVQLAASGALASDPSGALTVEQPAERTVVLGLVLDTAGQDPGAIEVVAVTPGGGADRLGLRAGDWLMRVNGQPVVAGERIETGARLRALVADAGGPVRVELRRAGRVLAIEGRVDPVEIPAYRLEVGTRGVPSLGASVAAISLAAGGGEGCGRISQFPSQPRSRKLYPVRILAIDGELPGPSQQDSFRASVGRHEVTVAENIDYRDLPIVYDRQRRQFGEKTFTVEVHAGKTALLAARLVDSNAARRAGGGEYWQPEVWKEVDEPCR